MPSITAHKNFHGGVILAAMLLASSLPVAAQGGEASIWSSAVPTFPTASDLMPVGGGGQVNGGFVLDTFFDPGTGTALQIGLRGQKRFEGLLTQNGTVYFADTGTTVSGSGTVGATWNYDLHLDFGTLEEDMFPENDFDAMPADASLEKILRTAGLLGVGDELTPLDLRDFEVLFYVDTDPSGATSFTVNDLNAFADAVADFFTVPAPDVRLLQASQNLEFDVFGGGGAFDPEVPGLYDFRLTVADPGTGEILASSAIQVAVGLPMDVADVEVTITESADPVVVDTTPVGLVHTVVVTNTSATTTAASVEVASVLGLPSGVSFVDFVPSAGPVTVTLPDVTWDVGDLLPGASETLTLTLSVDATAVDGTNVITHAATATSANPDPSLANNSADQGTSIACLDGDGDGVCDRDDNCPAAANGDQLDSDGDGNGNACDLCFGDDATSDDDGDGLCNDLDFCLGNEQTGDADQDGLCADRDCDDADATNACQIFRDNFETGDTTLWSLVMGEL